MTAERPVGPHIDQNARDLLDDLGLIALCDIGSVEANNTMQVVG